MTPAPASVWSVARRPAWIGALLLALAVAAGFAALGQWQLERSVEGATVVERDTETPRPLAEVAQPGTAVTEAQAGHVVEVTGTLQPGDYTVHSGRVDEGERGYWLVGHLVSDDGTASVAVALGWSPDLDDVERARDAVDGAPLQRDIVGRYLPGDAPTESDFEAGELTAVSPAELVNRWAEVPAPAYSGYIVADGAVDPLQPIHSPVPEAEVTLNWLNIFYAVEWIVFAGFAVYLWYRLVRDQWEKERDLAAQGATAAAGKIDA